MVYPALLPRPDPTSPMEINRRFGRPRKPFLQRIIDDHTQQLLDELWFTRKLVFENPQHSPFLERLQAAEEKLRAAGVKAVHAEAAKVDAEARLASAQEEAVGKTQNLANMTEKYRAAYTKAAELEEKMVDKDKALSAMVEVRAKNAQLQEGVAHMKGAMEVVATGQHRLVAEHAALGAENERLRGQLAAVSRASRNLLAVASRESPRHMGKRRGKASRKPSSAPKAIRGVEKRRSKAASKGRSS